MSSKTLKIRRTSIYRSWRRIVILIFFVITALLIFFFLSGYIKVKYPKSFIPEVKAKDLMPASSDKKEILLKNKWYTLEVDGSGVVTVKSTSGETIMASLIYYSNYEGSGESFGLDDVKVELNSDSTISIQGVGAGDVIVNVLLMFSKNNPKMDVIVNTSYNSNIIVRREALIAKFDVPISEVYLKNRKIDVKPFEREYWLQQQGIRLGRGSQSSLIYNTPDISSLQLNSKKKVVIVNLEYYLDHPLIYIPYQEDGGGKWVDRSAAYFTKGAKKSDHFSIYFGYIPTVTPRLMLVPNGYLAGYVFTEHADAGNIRTQRAAYFGSENISDPAKATGGFVGHEIPVTKSVFYHDLDGGLSESSADDSEESQYFEFLDDLYATGLYDLCLHTPEDTSSNREYLAEAIKFMKERYDAKTWIDHGMFPGNNNRETFVCDGFCPGSEFYAADLWEKYDTRYFWSSAVEKIRFSIPEVSLTKELRYLRLQNLSAELWRRYWFLREYQGEKRLTAFVDILKGYFTTFELNSLQPFKGNSFPTPLYWQNVTRTGQFYSWTTEFVYTGISPDMAEEKLKNEKRQLDKLESNWGVFMNHGYYVRNRKDDDILCKKNEELVINPYFDEILTYLDSLRDGGDMLLTTVKDLLNYWTLIENITFEYEPDGIVNIYNNNAQPVKGLSLALRIDVKAIRIDGKSPSSKQAGEDAIIWFDMPANSMATLQIKETNNLLQ